MSHLPAFLPLPHNPADAVFSHLLAAGGLHGAPHESGDASSDAAEQSGRRRQSKAGQALTPGRHHQNGRRGGRHQRATSAAHTPDPAGREKQTISLACVISKENMISLGTEG